jgi:hypothetical protein
LFAKKTIDKVKKRKVNEMIRSLVNEGFIVRMFNSANDEAFTYYLLLEMPLNILKTRAEKLKYLLKL